MEQSLQSMTAWNQAFEKLYRARFDFVWRTVRAMGISHAYAEDLVQEVFIAARRRLPTYDRNRSEGAWLFGITRNEVLAFRRAAGRYERRIHRVEPAPSPAQPDELLQKHQAAHFVEDFLAQLDEPMRLSFLLADLEGLPGREVAQTLEIPLQTHYSRVRAARRKLDAYAVQLHKEGQRDGTRG